MPLGTLTARNRLGIANPSQPNALDFARQVLQLPDHPPIYQQMLVRNQNYGQGPAHPSADWGCGPADADVGRPPILRQISGHECVFSRRNISDSSQFALNTYLQNYTQQLLYVGNEPEAFSSLSSQGIAGRCSCYEAPEWAIDTDLAGCFPTADAFWDTAATDGLRVNCASRTDWRRARADALAKVFLLLKRRVEQAGRQHVVLPPAAIDPELGQRSPYWTDFYDAVHRTGVGEPCAQATLSVPQLTALHTHAYTYYHPDQAPTDAIATVADLALRIRRGCDWYRDRYHQGHDLPLQYLLSECGPDWRIVADYDRDQVGIAWSGGFADFLQGLTYWNTWLAWVTRRAPYELGLTGWETGEHVLYACIHTPDAAPYAKKNTAPPRTRNQWCFDLDAWQTGIYEDAPVLQTELNTVSNQYHASFTFFNPIRWAYDDSTWQLGPFGACHAVWAAVANDPNTPEFGTGFWFDQGQAGSLGRTTVTVPTGWSTIYIPVIKHMGAFNDGGVPIQYQVVWHRGDGVQDNHGWLDFTLFPDSATINGQPIYSSMILPLLLYTSQSRTFQLEISRNRPGLGVFVGRPIVLAGVACTWSSLH